MYLDSSNYDEFWRRGWTVVEGVFSRGEAEAIARVATRICEDELAAEATAYHADRSDDGAAMAPRKLGSPFTKAPELRTFVLDPRLRSSIEQLVARSPLLCVDQILMKPPRFGSEKPYHQDNAYFRCHPDDEVITAWIALDDVDESNGCLRYIDGSHTGPILDHVTRPDEPHNKVPPQDQIDLSKEAPACVKKGGVVFHHCRTLHTSRRNESDQWRRGYATHWVTAGVTSEIGTVDNAYFNKNADLYNEAVASADARAHELSSS